jgi:hypothetical protein
MRDGTPIRSTAEWRERRRPELRELFQRHMYGFFPPATALPLPTVARSEAFRGTGARRKDVRIPLGPPGAPALNLMVLAPEGKRSPLFLGINFGGNDQEVLAPEGSRKNTWSVERTLARGYAVASFHAADADPDQDDFTDGVHPWHRPAGSGPERGLHEWGTVAAWAWGLSRALDYLETDPDVDARRVAVIGHSRMGKAALLAAAFDERFALAVPCQSGCGGAAPSRTAVGETVAQINANFPHWFCTAFREYNGAPERLPFDQHELIALVAPRPVLLCNAAGDEWANPAGQFEMLRAAAPVWRLLGMEGLTAERMPDPGRLADGDLGYFYRDGGHAMSPAEWTAALDFADRRL